MTTWDDLKVELRRLESDESRPLRSFPSPGVDDDRTPPFQIRLAPWATEVAADLHARFDDDVDLSVGALHYPDRTARNPDRSLRETPRTALDPLLEPDEVEVSLTEPVEVRSGYEADTKLELRNRRSAEVAIRTNGRVTARVVDPATGVTVGGFAGFQTAPLVVFRAAPGQSIVLPLLIGTASYDPALGYAIPPGHWAIEAVLDLEGDGPRRTPVFPITILG